MGKYFRKSKSLGADVKIRLGLCNYAKKADFKNETVVDSRILLKEMIELI